MMKHRCPAWTFRSAFSWRSLSVSGTPSAAATYRGFEARSLQRRRRRCHLLGLPDMALVLERQLLLDALLIEGNHRAAIVHVEDDLVVDRARVMAQVAVPPGLEDQRVGLVIDQRRVAVLRCAGDQQRTEPVKALERLRKVLCGPAAEPHRRWRQEKMERGPRMRSNRREQMLLERPRQMRRVEDQLAGLERRLELVAFVQRRVMRAD